MRTIFSIILLSALLLPACEGAIPSPTPLPSPTIPQVVNFSTGEVVTLRAGQAGIIPNEKLMLIFAGVIEDSRCPAKVACVWSGEARISLLASLRGAPPATLELSTLPDKGRISWEGFEIELRQVSPYPQTPEETIQPDQYTITLAVFVR